MNLKLLFAILSTVCAVGGGFIPYIVQIIRKNTKPHAYTWLIWSITQGTALAGLFKGKAGLGSLAWSVGELFVVAIFFLTLKFGTRNITRKDSIVLLLALSAIVVWWQLHSPLLAVLMVTAIDLSGYFPSFRKTYHEPWSESPIAWSMFALTSIFSIIALTEFNWLTLPYLIMTSAANAIFVVIIQIRRRIIPRPTT